jgi:hypothetical protein
MKTLYVTDFDDTLVKTDANVYLTKTDGEKVTLSPEEYAVYDIQSGDTFDFSEFEDLKNPKPISRFTELLKKVVQGKKADKVAVLTARGHTKPIAKFLQSLGIKTGVSIAALGDSNPQRKANYIEKHIKSGYDRVAFVDDSPKNIAAVDALRDKYPETKLLTHKVDPHKEKTTTGAQDDTPAQTKKPVVQKSSQRVTKADLGNVYRSKITNPTTGKQVLVLTALKNKNHPMHKQAMGMVAQMARQKNPNK